MPALFIVLWFCTAPHQCEARYADPVPAYACAMMGLQLKQIWGATGITCLGKIPPGAKPLSYINHNQYA